MKLLIVIALMALTLWAAIAHHFPQVGLSLPILGTITSVAKSSGLSAAPGKLVAAGEDISAVVHTHEFGGWHLVVIVLGVLVARKIAMWLLR